MSNNPKLATEKQVQDVSNTFAELFNHQGKQIKALESGVIDAIEPSSPAPTKRGEYKVTKVGVYINFKDGNGQPISVTQEDFSTGNVSIIFNGTDSRKLVVPITFEGEVKEGDTRGVSGMTVAKERYYDNRRLITNLGDLDPLILEKGDNLIHELVITPFTDTEIWGIGYLTEDNIVNNNASYRYSKKRYRIKEGVFDFYNYFGGNAVCLVFNKLDQVIQVIKQDANVYLWNKKVTFIEGSYAYQISTIFREDHKSSFKLTPTFGFTEVPDTYFTKTAKEYGAELFFKDINVALDLVNEPFTNTEVWKKGFLTENDVVNSNNTGWYHSDYITVCEGLWHIYTFMGGNACIIGYDENKHPLQVIKNEGGGYVFDKLIEYAKGVHYTRISFYDNTTHKSLIKLIAQFNKAVFPSNSKKNDTTNTNDIVNISKKNLFFKSPKPVISFISDDGSKKNLEWFIPILDQYNIKATFAIITSRFEDKFKAEWFSKQDVIDVFNQGHDIAGHTHSHIEMRQMEDVENDLYLNKLILQSIDDRIRPTMFIAPFGDTDTRTDIAVGQHYDADFVTVADTTINEGKAHNLPPINRLRIKRASFDNPWNDWKDKSRIDLCKQAVDFAISDGGWLVFAIHPQYEEYTNINNSVDRKKELEMLIEYIQSKQVPILTARQAYSFYKNTFEIGNELITPTDFTSIGMNGATKTTNS